MTIKKMIDNLQAIADQFGSEMQVEFNLQGDSCHHEDRELFYSIKLDSLRGDKFNDKLVIKID